MAIETWGEFEYSVAATLKNYVIEFVNKIVPYGTNTESTIALYNEGLFSGIVQSIAIFPL